MSIRQMCGAYLFGVGGASAISSICHALSGQETNYTEITIAVLAIGFLYIGMGLRQAAEKPTMKWLPFKKPIGGSRGVPLYDGEDTCGRL